MPHTSLRRSETSDSSQCVPVLRPRAEGIDRLAALNAALSEQIRLFEGALQNMNQGLCMFDAQSRLVVSNKRYRDIFNIPQDMVLTGMAQHAICSALVARGLYSPEVTVAEIERSTRAALQAAEPAPITRELCDGRTLAINHRVMDGGGWVSTFEDITEQRRSAERIAHLAHHDALTDLANTRAMRQGYRDLIAAQNDERPLLAMYYIDLDRFKFVNDTYGHAAGDELLQEVAARLRRNTRRGDVVARLGGDEFALVHRVVDAAAATSTAQRLVNVLSEPFDLASGRVHTGASIGLAIRAVQDLDMDPLLHDADLALRHSKTEGRGVFSVFEASMSEAFEARRQIEADLQAALAADQFELHYQTLVDARDGHVACVEALVRWRHPTRGLVPPLSFIPLAEETGLILPLGRWVLERACRDALAWPESVDVAVNVSSVQMRQKGFGAEVLAVLAETGLAAARLEVEITETSLLEESEATRENLATLHGAGIRIAMDDFGTGYSSLSYLRRFPIDKIKIDRSFMSEAETSADARAIIRAVAGLGVSLGITTVVEGVETAQQLELARAEGVGQVQGYLLGRPQPQASLSRAGLPTHRW
ncbi:diguanylate cyclase (GGDEF)-like protein [Methylobacterium sp. PvP062]|uniref:Diguanylate cyclase (GGDEF)-like protein n=1 Tax=Methylobacterium radiotolerans TaxID=31998 RepID=A0ABV2NKI8_9HYPH|nr:MULTISPECIES: EAL domain-containing protein [unclassified Methylobacterium]KIU31893.1 diguanylate cyclase [Methylobacterium radiotolerans]MCX7334233.1 EAL domain-containing protein [Hyphomicrobiales bacterium]MBP2496280.1 diguanylate cyclase (GGDEF)-like protein [Methylobacterium sp. PvP105]MBP2503849.1 diguanylate cyclase (GGDEF)-like protein [Methylobacterium sp. PvP109]RUP19825.1 MAG: EAL domain-containing protein [Methylobacterium sp.]